MKPTRGDDKYSSEEVTKAGGGKRIGNLKGRKGDQPPKKSPNRDGAVDRVENRVHQGTRMHLNAEKKKGGDQKERGDEVAPMSTEGQSDRNILW